MWPYIGDCTGIFVLALTTREEPDYHKLMRDRISSLRDNRVRLSDLQQMIAKLPALEGAREFIAELKKKYRVIIVSDAFIELAKHFINLIGNPELQCHQLKISHDGYIEDCRFLKRSGKHETVEGLQADGHHVLAVGDAFNDLSMLRAADVGVLFCPSRLTSLAAPDLPIVASYDEVLRYASAMLRQKIFN